MDKIIVKGARENNLKNIDIELPKNKLIVMTGVSGAGKSSLAFDTIYQEGQRRFVESLSSFARQFIGGNEKPDVDSIDGLSPAISIDQKSASHNPRSTVGTVTEIHDYLRVLFARVGTPYCPTHKIPISSLSIDQIVDRIMEKEDGKRLYITAPVVFRQKGEHKAIFEKYLKAGYVRALVDGEMIEIENAPALEKNKKHNIYIVLERLVKKEGVRSRIFDAVELAVKESFKKPLNQTLVDNDITSIGRFEIKATYDEWSKDNLGESDWYVGDVIEVERDIVRMKERISGYTDGGQKIDIFLNKD